MSAFAIILTTAWLGALLALAASFAFGKREPKPPPILYQKPDGDFLVTEEQLRQLAGVDRPLWRTIAGGFVIGALPGVIIVLRAAGS